MDSDEEIMKMWRWHNRKYPDTVVDIALQFKRTKYLKYLLEVQKKPLTQDNMMRVVEGRNIGMMKHLCGLGLKVNFPGHSYIGAAVSCPAMIVELVRLGADVNAKDNEGSTPLQRSIVRCPGRIRIDVMSFLIKHGADVNMVDNEGHTPLIYCFENCKSTRIEEIKLLFRHGADERVKDRQGRCLKQILRGKFTYNAAAVASMLTKRETWRAKKSFLEVCTTFFEKTTTSPTSRENNKRIKKNEEKSPVSFLEVNVDILHVVFSFL